MLYQRTLAAGLALLFSTALTAAPLEPRSYTTTIAGRVAGEMTVGEDAAGVRSIAYSYVDRGRGPEVKSTVRLDAAQRPVQLSISGVDYFKVPVDERFDRQGTSATWTSAPDAGTTQAEGFYLPNEMTPEHLALLARALLAAPDRSLPLLPTGRARIVPSVEHRLSDGGAARLYLIEGLGFDPQAIWLDRDGELVAQGGTWTQTVRRDLAAIAPDFVRLQEQVTADRERAQARELIRRPAGDILIRNARLFDARAKAMRDDTDVLVSGNRIRAVGRDLPAPAGAEVIDATGKALLPGLWDMHVHVNSNTDGFLHLGAGVTTVRDMAMDMDELLERRRRFDTNELVGPRILMAGFLDGPGPLAAPSKALVDTPEEVRGWIDRYADAGYVQIKLYSSLDPKLVPVAVEAARARGLRVSGHVPATMTLEEAVRLGFDEAQHVNFLFLNFMEPDILAKTNGMTRFFAPGERAKDQPLDSAEVARLVALLKERGTVLDPTLVAFEDMYLGQRRTPAPNLAAVADRLPPVVRRGTLTSGMAKDDATRADYRRSYQRMKEMVGHLHKAGVTIVPGTDDMPGLTYHRELELYAEAGVPLLDILHLATLGSALVTKRDADLGSVEPGKLADLVLVDGDPSKNISDIRRTALVIKDGALFDPNKLFAAIGVTPAR